MSFAAGGEHEYDGAGIPGPAVPGRRRHRPHHEDEEDTQSQHAHSRAVRTTQVPRQSEALRTLILARLRGGVTRIFFHFSTQSFHRIVILIGAKKC